MPSNVHVSTAVKSSWLERTYAPLFYETTAVCLLLSLAALLINARAISAQIRARKQLKDGTSDRTAIFTKLNTQVHESCKWIFKLSAVYTVHALAVFLINAFYYDAKTDKTGSDNATQFSGNSTFELAYMLFYIILLVSAFVVAPLAQTLLAAFFLGRLCRKNNTTALGAYIAEARIASTHLAFLWAMLYFGIVIWLPNYDMVPLMIMMASFGSATAWLDASYQFNFREDHLDDSIALHSPFSGVGLLLSFFAHKQAVPNTQPEEVHEKCAEV